MPHVVCSGSPVALMTPEAEKRMRAEVIIAMAAVEGSGFEERQVALAIPAETQIADADRPNYYKPFFHVRFAFERNRNDNTLEAVCMAAAQVFYRYFHNMFDVTEVQFSWEVNEAGRFNRYPPKDVTP